MVHSFFVRKCRVVGTILLLAYVLASAAGESGDYIHYRLGIKYKNEQKYDQALDEFHRVLAAYPDNYNTYMHIAEIQVAQQKNRLAMFNLKRALAYNPGWGKAHRMLADLYEQDRQYQSAIKEWQEYQQICDPAQVDSVQQIINRLLKGAPAAPVKAATGEEGPAAGKEPAGDKPRPAVARKAAPASTRVADPAAAREPFKRVVLLYQQGVDNQDNDRLNQALDAIQQVLSLQPGHAGAYYYAGLIRRRFGQNQMAKINFEKSLGFPDLGYNAHFYLGKIYGEERQYATAVDHLQRYVSLTDYEVGKREASDLIIRYQALIDAARADTLKVDVKAVSQGALQDELSHIPPRAPLGALEVRIDSLLSMMIVDTLSDQGQAMLAGVRLFHEGKFNAAIEAFRQVQARYPQGDVAAFTLYNIGVCHFKIRDFTAAENVFSQVVNRFGTRPVAARSLFLKGLAAYERHELNLAESLLRSFLQNNRTHPWAGTAWERLGDVNVSLERHGKAIDAYTQAAAGAATTPDKIHALYKQGVAYTRLDNQSRAHEVFRQVIAIGDKAGITERVPDACYRIADQLYKKGELPAALDYYLTATRKYPQFQDTPWGLFQIGGIYKKNRQFDKAIAVYNDLIGRYPQDYWARQAQWKKEDAVWENEYGAVLE